MVSRVNILQPWRLSIPRVQSVAFRRERLGLQAIVTGFALQPSTTATAIRGDVVTDGPFIEAKEVVAGFFILEAPDLDVALQIAKANPATIDGGVEVRPLFIPPSE